MRRQTKPAVAPVYADEITALVRSNLTPGAVGKRLLDYHANDIATALENMSAVDRKRLFLALTPEALSDVFAYMDDMALAAAYLDEQGITKRAETLEHMDADRIAALLQPLEQRRRADLLALMDESIKRKIAIIGTLRWSRIMGWRGCF